MTVVEPANLVDPAHGYRHRLGEADDPGLPVDEMELPPELVVADPLHE
ncbi:MAG: hypothetical protein ACRYG2_20330 [Janthinobacterium lividum]